MPRPERGTPEYDAYKAAKRAKEARESRSANLLTIDSSHSRHRSRSRHSGYGTSDSDDEGRRIRTHSPAPDSEDRSRRRRRAESGGNLLTVEDHRSSRHRSLSRHSGYGSEDSCDEGRRIRTHSPAPDSESVATEDRARRRRRRGDSSGNLLTVDDPRDRRSSRHRSVSRHSGYGDSEDEEGGRRIRTHSRDPAYGEDKSRRRPERERSRVRFEEDDRRRSQRSPERESYRDQDGRKIIRDHSPAPPVFVERVETLKGESSAGSSARRKGKDGEKSKDRGVYNAPEPPISYQPPAYVDTAAAIGALGVLPGKKPSRHGHSQSMSYSGSGRRF
ncbi:hypothetical protein EX30DRAFT_55569 [Ascodesmis nigricans]|uniref:Uncharacterized protein n=1 Tax=Ascodesmis nigricans TaxID=341454 RepID=A0A4S2MUS9_9PEZI|nr:hypothetical protein EX30DRAFT_55569 [Ascodesmis nigricans]